MPPQGKATYWRAAAVMLATVLTVLSAPQATCGQAAQAMRVAETQRLSMARDSAVPILAALEMTYARLADQVMRTQPALAAAFLRSAADTRAALSANADPDRFAELTRQALAADGLTALERQGVQLQEIGANDLESLRSLAARMPLMDHVVPDVVFVAGPGLAATSGGTILDFALSSTLLGAAAGAVFDAIGAKPVADYLKDNVAAGFAIPRKQRKITSVASVSIGHFRIADRVVLPTLGVEEMDTTDERIPRSLAANPGARASWASPVFTLAIVPFTAKQLEERACKGQLIPVPTLGVRMPHFYPGDAFETVAALFSSNRSKFERAGSARLVIGLGIPLYRITSEAERKKKCPQ
jgi:hypothetical protein